MLRKIWRGAGLLPLSLAAALLAGCAREPAEPSFGSSSTPYSSYYARPVEPWAASAEREAYGLPDVEDAPKAAPAPRRAKRKRLNPDDVARIAPAPVPATPDDPRSCVGWWRICHFL